MTCELASKIELGILENKVKDFEVGINKIKKEMVKTEDNIAVTIEELSILSES